MRPLVNMVERFGDDYEFFIVTRDHDGKADKTPYSNITYGVWHPVGKAAVRYLAKDQIRVGEIKKIAREVRPDLVFCNSYFSTRTFAGSSEIRALHFRKLWVRLSGGYVRGLSDRYQ